MKCYSIFDKTAGAYSNPFFALNDGMAVRMFSQVVNDPNSHINKQPNEFNLYLLGEFDEHSGVISGLSDGPDIVIFGSEVVESVLSKDKVELQLEHVVNFIEELRDTIGDLAKLRKLF
jgi:hypothetical protein